MTPRAQAAAPPTPDEMREAEELAKQWYDASNAQCYAWPLEMMDEHYNDLIARIAAALSTTAAQAEARVRQECAEVARNYRLHEPDRVCCMGRNERIAAAILAQTPDGEADLKNASRFALYGMISFWRRLCEVRTKERDEARAAHSRESAK
jgi:hypothetical protein